MKIFNTLSRKIEDFKPIEKDKVGMYTCGPTVYDFQHVGNYRKYIGDDILRRVLEINNFQVKHIMNITDVGHLTSDEDSGEDKMEKGAERLGKTVWEVAQFYEEDFWQVMQKLNVLHPSIVANATKHINEQIKLIQKLEEKGFTYQTEQAIYFDISKFPDYGKLSGQKLEDEKTGARSDVVVDSNKKNPQDFALWFFTVGHFKNHEMKWTSPWGEGFPGWHIECSAMSMEYLGDTIDIHTGGVDHIPVHHTNEIAQSEAATGKKFVNYWVHHEFLLIDGGKMSKSLQNFYTLKDIEEKGIDPLALRYLFLTAHYRDKLNFTWESLQAAQNALNNLRDQIREWDQPSVTLSIAKGISPEDDKYVKFYEALNNDLNTPQALAIMWELVKSDLPEKASILLEMDKVLGLDLEKYLGQKLEIPEPVLELVEKREQAREQKDFQKSDEIRKEINKLGYEVLDTTSGSKVKRI